MVLVCIYEELFLKVVVYIYEKVDNRLNVMFDDVMSIRVEIGNGY